MATGKPGPVGDGSQTPNPSSFFPSEGLFEDGWCRVVSLRHPAGLHRVMATWAMHLFVFALSLALTLSSLLLPWNSICNQVLAYKLLLSLCVLGMWAETVPRVALGSSPSG